MGKKITYEDKIIDWVISNSGEPNLSPTDAHFSATEVAYMIIKYNRDKLSGKLNN